MGNYLFTAHVVNNSTIDLESKPVEPESKPMEPESKPMEPITEKELNQRIAVWFGKACVRFIRFTPEQVLDNDTQYDIDSLEDSYREWYFKLTGKRASHIRFVYEVTKRCKQSVDTDSDSEY